MNYTNLHLTILEARGSKIKVLTDLVSGEGLPFTSRITPSHCVLMWQKGKEEQTPLMSFNDGANPTNEEALVSSKYPPS
jgi:hypothetical protein